MTFDANSLVFGLVSRALRLLLVHRGRLGNNDDGTVDNNGTVERDCSTTTAPTAPASPIHQRFENLASEFLQPASSSSAAATVASKKSRKISLPKVCMCCTRVCASRTLGTPKMVFL